MKMKRFVGIDPGKQGGVAWVDVSNKGVERNAISFKDMTPRDLFETLSDVMDDVDDCTVVIERVGTMPKDSASNAFKFGYSAGMLEAAAVAASKPYHFVVPPKWQKFMKCQTKGDKAVTRKMAQQLFPGFHLRITNQIADAMLICEYCRKVHGETLSEPEAPKKRGRKPKGEMVVLSEKVGTEVTESFLPDEQPKKRRGRPRKVASVDKAVPSDGQTESTPKK
jgi:Holliday junction resolvasome RuvABC endonuclease subunit